MQKPAPRLSRCVVLSVLLTGGVTLPALGQATDPYDVGGVQCSAEDELASRARFRVVYDINSDGRADYLLAKAPCGNAGCSFDAVLSSNDTYRSAGRVFFHPLAARIEPLGTGLSVLQAYVRSNAERGLLVTTEISDSGVRVLSEEAMWPRSDDADRYRTLFGPAVRSPAERGTCETAGGALSWRPYPPT